MTAHQLAQLLLKGEDLPVLTWTMNGFEEVEETVQEDYHHELLCMSQEEFPKDDDSSHGLFERQNNDPSVILISKSFGVG